MLRDHRSPNIDGVVWTDGSDLPFPNLLTRFSPPKSTDVISFVISDFRIFKSQTLLSSVCQSSRVDNLRTPVLLNQRPCFYFGCLTFQLDQRSCDPSLSINGRYLLRVSGLMRSQISNFTSPWSTQDSVTHPTESDGWGLLRDFTQSSQIYATSLLIWRSRFTSNDLTLEIHFRRSNDWDLL
jgi:hypothetical protein